MATEIKISVPDQHVSLVLDAMGALADKRLDLVANGPNFQAMWSYSYEPKQPGETNKQFAVRVVRENLKALVRLYSLDQDRIRYDAELATITKPVHSVPDEVVE